MLLLLLFKVKTGGKGCAGDIKGGGLGGVTWNDGGGGEGEVLLVAVLGAAVGLIIGKFLRGGWGGLVGGVWEVVGLPVIVVVEAVDVLVATFVLLRHTCGVCHGERRERKERERARERERKRESEREIERDCVYTVFVCLCVCVCVCVCSLHVCVCVCVCSVF
jgi:uncharacterized membrane protein